MISQKDVFKIGAGPSSSHTMGPERASIMFKQAYPTLKSVKCTLFGSLALTGKGHLTDWIIEKSLAPVPVEFVWNYLESNIGHENTMMFEGTLEDDTVIEWTIYSIGGGDVKIVGFENEDPAVDVYPHNTFTEISEYCESKNISYFDYVMEFEPEVIEHLTKVWDVMKSAIYRGITADGKIPGELGVTRRAKALFNTDSKHMRLEAYAYAVNEENASGGQIVTAPTCGAAGVLPAVLKYYQDDLDLFDEQVIEGLAVAGLLGAVVKHNATISGAEGGCQAEVGTATAMAAGAAAYLNGCNNRQIEAAAEIGLEHQIGLTCDPVLGYVQVPCIQRNAVGAGKAKTAFKIAQATASEEQVYFDTIVEVMYETGKDMAAEYRETSLGGLAKLYKNRLKEDKENK
ncbi:L-serine ammonia-lyase, iron-sulfur-dependent, subunit alpha [Mollicutes bacterium LVI A0078]|nr:L-serine ammonia-lyase, iron-sulfur-dependent, subunit alpha [Mollicutes bacterium LVI A0075]WOO90428.1 L-serine ammonia-lyase, iron-sulfur-dependent, subunit alpha [Mollicutes bacterium LVI A0078]